MPKWLTILLGRPARISHIVWNVLAPLLQIGILVWLIVIYPTIPDQVPTHYGAGGEITAWGGKGILWLMPVVGIVDDIIMWGVQFLPRQSWNTGVKVTVQNAAYVYGCAHDMIAQLRFTMSVLFASLSAVTILQLQRFPEWVPVAGIVLVFLPVLRYLLRIAKLKRR